MSDVLWKQCAFCFVMLAEDAVCDCEGQRRWLSTPNTTELALDTRITPDDIVAGIEVEKKIVAYKLAHPNVRLLTLAEANAELKEEAERYQSEVEARYRRDRELYSLDNPTPHILRHVNLSAPRPDSSAD